MSVGKLVKKNKEKQIANRFIHFNSQKHKVIKVSHTN